MTVRRYISAGCLLTCLGLVSMTAYIIFKFSAAVSTFTIQTPNLDLSAFYAVAITEVVDHGEPQQKLELLEALHTSGQSGAGLAPLLEPLLNDPSPDVRAAALMTFSLVDPSAVVRASGPPPPAMPRDTIQQ